MASKKSVAAASSSVNSPVLEDSSPASSVLSQFTTRDLDPREVIILPELANLRDRASDQYRDYIMNLAQTIYEEGQIEPGVVKETPDGLVLIAGQCRLEAVSFIQSDEGQEILGIEKEEDVFAAANFKFRAEVRPDTSADITLRLASLENIQRRSFTDIEIAKLIKLIRERFGYERTESGDKEVADYLGMGSPANVREHEKLLTLSPEIQAAVQAERMSMSAALEHRNVKPDKLGAVTELAQKKANEDKEEKRKAKEAKAAEREEKQRARAEERHKKFGSKPTPKNRPAGEVDKKVTTPKPTSKPDPKPATVESKHVRAAAKELDAVGKTAAPKMSELKSLAEAWCGPVYPKVITSFAEGLISWSAGKLTDKQMTGLLDNVAELIEDDEVPETKAEIKPKTVTQPLVKKVTSPAPVKKIEVKAVAKKTAPPAKKVATKAPAKTPTKTPVKSTPKKK